MVKLNKSDFHLPYNPALIARAKELRKNMTPAEKKLWYGYLRNFDSKVLRQRPIDYFIVDFYCPSLKLVIEVDGESHYSNEGQDYDRERTQRLEGYKIKVVRFTNQQVLGGFEGVCGEIQRLIPPAPLIKGGEYGPPPERFGILPALAPMRRMVWEKKT